MKQHITIEQLNELTDKAKEKLDIWWDKKYKHLWEVDEYYKHQNPLLSIGQMIEFLRNNSNTDMNTLNNKFLSSKVMAVNHFAIDVKNENGVFIAWNGELCDALWEAVKEILEYE